MLHAIGAGKASWMAVCGAAGGAWLEKDSGCTHTLSMFRLERVRKGAGGRRGKCFMVLTAARGVCAERVGNGTGRVVGEGGVCGKIFSLGT